MKTDACRGQTSPGVTSGPRQLRKASSGGMPPKKKGQEGGKGDKAAAAAAGGAPDESEWLAKLAEKELEVASVRDKLQK